ncbi:MATE family efflux transporter [Actinoplanes sichuanensis]|uniref:Multidrug export protein MepA n=1 Tax=Actinoplanes sichuanensis TaxID=512349 RepID=A0ABW4AKL1_9ACTN|nr:MATE family efflux transporter [Actinoplanes sichuanensis]BEL04005.1 MATE family efflux transporter [Actinoplanes sichuanensis]
MTDSTAMLGSRPLGRLLWHTSSQTTLSVGVYGVYALTNAWFVARGVGADAMAAVNLAAPVLLVLGAVSTTVGVGGASLVSRCLGAGDQAGAARAAGNTFAVFWAAAALTTVVGLLGIEPLLTALGADAGTRDLTRDYAIVLLCGALVSTGFSSLVRAEGRLRFSTMLWVIPVLVQITLDPLLIFGFGWGVRGAALGTVGGQAVSAVMSIWFFFRQRDRPYRITRSDLVPHGPTVWALVGVGAPSFLAGFGATLLAVLVNNTLAGVGGSTALAAYAVCARIQTFVMMPQLGISQGLQPVVGYNAGRGYGDRVRRARTLSLRASVVYGIVSAIVVAVFADPLVAFFLPGGEAAATAGHALRIIAVGFAAAGVTPLISAYSQALGRPALSYVISVGALLAVKAPLVVVLAETGVTGVWLAIALGEIVTAVAALLFGRSSPRPRGHARSR